MPEKPLKQTPPVGAGNADAPGDDYDEYDDDGGGCYECVGEAGSSAALTISATGRITVFTAILPLRAGTATRRVRSSTISSGRIEV